MELKTARGRLFFLILVLLAFPLLNHHYKIIKSSPLKDVMPTEKPAFSYWGLWDGSYQASLNSYLNDVVGFREDMIRFVNQIDFSFFNKINVPDFIIGKNNDLFFKEYIDAYCGIDYNGDEHLLTLMLKMKAVQDTLEKMGKTFVFVHAASKVSYNPEDIPDNWNCKPNGKTNLKTFVHLEDSLGIHQIDFDSWFVSLKGKTEHSLFIKQGIHWSLYGSMYAVDSLIRFIERSRNIEMLHPVWTQTDYTYMARNEEGDMERLLNLVFPIDTGAYWYQRWQYVSTGHKKVTKPMIIYIGDSFMKTLFNNGIMNSDSASQFWYYNAVFIPNPAQPIVSWDNFNYQWVDLGHVYDIKWQETIQKADCIVLVYTASRLISTSAIFIENAYAYYYPSK